MPLAVKNAGAQPEGTRSLASASFRIAREGRAKASNDSGNLWGGYPDEIATAGNRIEALNAGGAVIGMLVTGPHTVT